MVDKLKDVERVSAEITNIILKQGLEKICYVLDSQIPESEPVRVYAAKRIVEDILNNISKDVGRLLHETINQE